VIDHASAELLAQFVDDTLAAEERRSLEDHLDRCDDCRSTVAMLVKAAIAERRASEPTLGGQPGEAFLPTAPSGAIGSPDGSPLAAGTRLGRYVIGETLGTGGMGVVYAAHDPDLDRDLAVKVMRPELSRLDPDAARRIVREAQAMAKISHPNVVAVFDVGTVVDQVFVAMERIHGTSLRSWLAATQRSAGEIVDTFVAAGRGLIAAHDAGIVHRDFKPDNVLVGRDGRPRVTDFGLAFEHAVGDAEGERSMQPIAGTPAYMAPEQHAGGHVDARTDQFSFAVALFEALYGKRPFAGRTPGELASAVRAGRIEAGFPGRHVPASLRAILSRALSVRPGDRYATMAELLRALGRDRGRLPRRIASAAVVAFAVVAVAFGADAILRDRARAVTRTSFAAARTQLDKLFALRTETFIAQADAMYRLPIMQEIATSRDQADFGLGDVTEDRERLEHQHETLRSADWVGLVKTHTGDVLAIADQKGRLLYDTADPTSWGTDLTAIAAIGSAYASQTDAYLGVLDAADRLVVESNILGGVARQKLYVAFTRGKRVGARPDAMFMQLVEAGRLLDDVGVGQDTMLSVVTVQGVAEGRVPRSVLLHLGDGGIDELSLDDGTWLAERTPLRATGQGTAIAQLVLARRTNVGLSGLFPHARLALGVLAGFLLALAAIGFVVARNRDLGRREPDVP